MNIDNLKCFILVAENLSFARAAEAMYISQPAVTKQINALESEIGTALFSRSTRHVELTPAGMSFYKDAKDIVTKAQMAINHIQMQNKNTESIRIGLSNTIVLSYLSPILSKFHAEHPNIRPSIEVLSYKTILSLFLEKRLDVLFYYKENVTLKAGIHFKKLENDYLSCLMPANHPLALRETISVNDLEHEVIIACNPLNAPLSTATFQQRLLKIQSSESILYCNSVEIAHCMVSAGMGITILPSILCSKTEEFAVIPLNEGGKLSFGVFYHRQNNNNAVDKFLHLL